MFSLNTKASKFGSGLWAPVTPSTCTWHLPSGWPLTSLSARGKQSLINWHIVVCENFVLKRVVTMCCSLVMTVMSYWLGQAQMRLPHGAAPDFDMQQCHGNNLPDEIQSRSQLDLKKRDSDFQFERSTPRQPSHDPTQGLHPSDRVTPRHDPQHPT